MMTRNDPAPAPDLLQQFIAIDWSGARGPRLSGLRVAHCHSGHGLPRLLHPPEQRHWTRTLVWRTVCDLARSGGPILAAFDMGLGLPYGDHDAYFPGLVAAPHTARQLWQAVDTLSRPAPDFYAGPFCQPPSPYAPYFNAPHYRGPAFDIHRARLTEQVCRTWTRPSSVFNGVGAGSVGMGSLAGMRLLHHIRTQRDPQVAIWPFNRLTADTKIVIVEMFPRLYALQAGADPRRWREPDFLPHVLRHYGTQGRMHHPFDTEDETDAFFSAAAIRHLARNPAIWCPATMTQTAAQREGWIFGVT